MSNLAVYEGYVLTYAGELTGVDNIHLQPSLGFLSSQFSHLAKCDEWEFNKV